MNLITEFPEFLPIYQEITEFSMDPEVLMTMFSQELYIMDRNTERMMVTELQEKVAEMGNALAEKDNALAEKDNALAEKDNALAEKDNALAEKDNALAESAKLIAELQAQLMQKQ